VLQENLAMRDLALAHGFEVDRAGCGARRLAAERAGRARLMGFVLALKPAQPGRVRPSQASPSPSLAAHCRAWHPRASWW